MQKENLENLLKLVKELTKHKQLEWFKDDLAKFFNNHNYGSDIKKIEKYLSLNGYKIIDYSKIKVKIIRDQLNRDCIEMHKYRLGLINNTVNFEEFCRYAHLQAEELLNYYFNTKFDKDIKLINDFISERLPDYGGARATMNIGYEFKLKPFLYSLKFNKNMSTHITKKKEFDKIIKNVINELVFVKEIRNNLSHRSSLDDVEDDKILEEAKKFKIDLEKLSRGLFIPTTNFNPKKTRIFYKARSVIKRRTGDYKRIIRNLEILRDCVIFDL